MNNQLQLLMINKFNQSIFIMLDNSQFKQQQLVLQQTKNLSARGSYVKGMFNSVHKWQEKLREHSRKDKRNVPEVESFRLYIKKNSIIKMYFQGALDQIPPTVLEYYPEDGETSAYIQRKTVSYGLSWQELLDQFAVVVTTPPDYSDEGIIGVPFYSLVIDMLKTNFGKIFFALEGVNINIKPIFDAYGRFLDSPESREFLTTEPNGWLSSTRVNYDEIICDKSKPFYGFESWHAWFTRQIKQQSRPFDENAENIIINSSENYPNFNMPKKNVKWHDKFWLKDTRYSLAEMFGADSLPEDEQQYFRDAFENGTVYQCYLSTFCYHKWRSPVNGVIQKCYKIGNCYFDGNPNISFDVSEIQLCSQPLLSMVSVRQVFVIKADNPKIGRICIIEIGMAEISGLQSLVKEGQRVKKGQLLGMFRFGGSSQAYIFDRNAQNLVFNEAIFERVKNNDFGTLESVLQLVRSPLAYVS